MTSIQDNTKQLSDALREALIRREPRRLRAGRSGLIGPFDSEEHWDEVDIASRDSFPCSDPPGYGHA